MANEAKRESKVLEEVRDTINNFLIFDFTDWEKDYEKAYGIKHYIENHLTVLRDSSPYFKRQWHDIRYATYMKSPEKFRSSLDVLRLTLTEMIPRQKAREANVYAKSLSHRINIFSSELSALLDDISDFDEDDLKHLSPEILCIMQEIAGLAKELDKTINSKISSK